MTKEQAIATAQSALRLRHNVTHTNNTIWRWRGFGWDIRMSENGNILSVIDEWKEFRTQ